MKIFRTDESQSELIKLCRKANLEVSELEVITVCSLGKCAHLIWPWKMVASTH